jgi:type II secretory pathway predicted ATPase ExeA
MKTPQPFWKHWGLRKHPFGNIETADDVFESTEMQRIMDHLAEAVEEGGIYSVTGERGIGKTTAKNEILAYFHEHGDRFAYSVLEAMNLSDVTMATILTAIITDLSNERPRVNNEQRARQVRRILGELADRKKIVLVIDEAQRLRIPTLEHLKMLTEMKWGFRSKLISVVLIGQPELNYRLSRDEGLLMRVTQFHMRGMTPDEVLQYIDLRCRTAGGDMRNIFSDDTLTYIAENQHSPLHINHVCSTTMRMCRRTGERKVTLTMVYESGGIRSPREILRDNKISVKEFSKRIHMHDKFVTRMLNGETEGCSPEQQERFRNGLKNVAQGTELDTEYSEKEKREKAAATA